MQIETNRWTHGAKLAPLFAVALALTATGCGSSAPVRPAGDIAKGDYSFAKRRVAYDIKKAIDENAVAGVTVALIDDQEVVFADAYGHADKARATPTEVDTVFRAGSVSKLFTGIALMQLVEAGTIDLDAPLTQYIPEFSVLPPPPWFSGAADAPAFDVSAVTLRRMMTHRSGLFGDLFKNMMDEKTPADGKDVLAFAKGEHMAAPPDEVHAYSNVAYALLGEVIERVSSERYADYIENHIFAPCNMKTSAFVLEKRMLGMFAQPHEKGAVKPHYLIGMQSAGSLYTTVGDLANFTKMLMAGGDGPSGTVVQPETLEKMWTEQNEAVRTRFDDRMGLTFFIDRPSIPGADRSVAHGGATLYHRASLVVLPREKLAAVALSNSAEAQTGKYTQVLLTAALANKLGTREPKEPQIADGEMGIKDMDAFVGEWTTDLGYAVITRDDDELKLRALEQDLILVPTKNGGVRIAAQLFGLFTIMPDSLKRFQLQTASLNDATVLVGLSAAGERKHMGDRITALPAVPPEWASRTGTYLPETGPTEGMLFESIAIQVRPPNKTVPHERLVVIMAPAGADERLPLVLYASDAKSAWLYGRGRNLGRRIGANRDGSLLFQGITWRKK